MDDLWGPPSYYQAPEDTESFSFAYDDTAINEKCCIQVLNILISKQDTDISELEDELMELLNQLACSDVEFSDMVSISLRGNVDFLDSAVKKLKDDAGDFSSTSRKPAESINDMMKSLFCGYLRKKDQQFAEKTRNVSSSYQVSEVNPFEKLKQMSSLSNAKQPEKSKSVVINAIPLTRVKTEEDNSVYPFAEKTCNVSSSYQVSEVNLFEKLKQMSSSSNAKQPEKSKSVVINAIPLTRVKTEEDNSIYPCINPISKYSAHHPFLSSLKKTNKCQKKPPNITTNDIRQKNTPICKFISHKRSLETLGKLKMVKSQPDNETIGPLSICVVESSQEPEGKQMQNTNRDLVLFDEESNPENHHQQPNVSLSVKKALKKQQILNSQLMISSRPSPLLLEGPKKKYPMNYFTLPELKAIAKERNIKGYSKYRKVELAELLGIELNEGKKPRKETEDTASSEDTGWAMAIVG